MDAHVEVKKKIVAKDVLADLKNQMMKDVMVHVAANLAAFFM